MPADFIRCVNSGGRVRTISGPNAMFGVKKGQYRHVCFKDGKSYLGEIKTKKKVKDGK